MSGQRIEDCENNTKAAWYENHYDCSECNAAWTDEWSYMCNDRCPECDCETQPTSSVDLSHPLTQDDYQGAARLLTAALSGAFVKVTPEDAKAYAEAVMEGWEDRFSPPGWETLGGVIP